MKIEVAAHVDIGKKTSNDDRILVNQSLVSINNYFTEVSLPFYAIVCDGCGGYAGGNLAAEATLKEFSSRSIKDLDTCEKISDVLEQCKKSVFKIKKESPAYSKMCTTIAGCVFLENQLLIFHSGDSRVYRFDGKTLAKMTIDHSVVQEMVFAGKITEEEAWHHPKRNVINRCIGVDCLPPDIYLSNTTIMDGETYLLCSDGLWEAVNEQQIVQTLSSNLSLDKKASSLVDLALYQGSDDNISVCICSSKAKPIQIQVVQESFVLD